MSLARKFRRLLPGYSYPLGRAGAMMKLLQAAEDAKRTAAANPASPEEIEFTARMLQHTAPVSSEVMFSSTGYETTVRDNIRRAFLTEPLWRRMVGWLTLRSLRHWCWRRYITFLYR